MMKRFKTLLLCFALLLVSACDKKTTIQKKDAFFFDTQISIAIYGDYPASLLDECIRICEENEHIFSRTKKDSELYAINHRSTSKVTISKPMKKVIETGLKGYEITNHKFDMTIAPLLDLWSFTENKHIPSKQEMNTVLPHIGCDKLSLEGQTLIFKDELTQIDTGALAKGYIADELKRYLTSKGVKSALINLGGNVITIGSKPDGSKWNIGVQKPFGEQGESIYQVKGKDISVVSSGIYERSFTKENVLYHHLLDPENGYPLNNGLWQVTIITPSSLQADLLSSACYLMGLEQGMHYIESLEDVEAIFVDDHGNVFLTSGLQE